MGIPTASLHPTLRFLPAAADIGFAPYSGRSDAYG